MKLLLFLFGAALAAGLYFVLADLLKIPRLATERALISAGRKERSLVKSLEALILGWSLKLAPLIRLDAYKRRRLETKLTAAGLDMDREIDAHLKQDNCSSRSEFVMNALKFYVGYLNTKNASAFLPEVLSATLTGTLDGFAGRISSLLFKQGVDINLMAQIIAYDTDIDEGAYERLRGKAIRDMKRTNGRISFKDAMDFQKSV